MKRSEIVFGIVQLLVDVVAIFSAFIVSYFIRIQTSDMLPIGSIIRLEDYAFLSLAALPVWMVVFSILGLYDTRALFRGIGGVHVIFTAVSTGTMFLVASIFITKEFNISRLVILYIWILSFVFVVSERWILRKIKERLWQKGKGLKTAVIVGSGVMAQTLAKKLSRNLNLGIKPLGMICDRQLSKEEQKDLNLKIYGNLTELKEILQRVKPDEVLLAYNASNRQIYNLALLASNLNADFKYIPNTRALITSYVIAEDLAGIPVLHLKDSPLFGWGRVAKRLMDICGATLGLLLASLPMVIIAILIKATSKGPVFYKQERVGRGNKKFKLLKFRSMPVGAERKTGPVWATPEDKRPTPLGRILRKSSLDELPQLINVLRGDMSLVGPRPERPYFVEQFARRIPHYLERHRVRPGLTGWAVVNGLRGNTSIEERTKYDLYYIENWSIFFDIKILFRTIWIVIKGVEAY